MVEAGARLTLIESFDGPDGIDYQVNSGNRTRYRRWCPCRPRQSDRRGTEALHVSTLAAATGAHAPITTSFSPPVARWCETRHFVRLAARALTPIRGATLLKNRQHVDTTLVVEHIARDARAANYSGPCSTTRRTAFSKATSSCAARAKNRRQNDDARVAAVRRAEADNKPELKYSPTTCSAAMAPLPRARQDLKFYLMARGIPRGRRSTTDPGVRRRGDRRHRTCRLARGPDRERRRLAWSALILRGRPFGRHLSDDAQMTGPHPEVRASKDDGDRDGSGNEQQRL